MVVPPIVLALAKHPLVDEFDLSSLDLVNSGGAPLSAEVEVACGERLRCRIKQGYGLTETTSVTHSGARPMGWADAWRGGTAGPEYRVPDSRYRDGRGSCTGGRGGRGVYPRPAGDEGLPQQPSGDDAHDRRRRLASHR